jgi:hypothetical protein
MHLNGTVKFLVPIGAIVTLIVGLHVLQQKELGAVRVSSAENTTTIARVDERTEAQFAEILRSLERIEKELE